MKTVGMLVGRENTFPPAFIDTVNRKGASVGVFLVEGKATLFVNLPSSKLEGVDFGSDLLRLAKVIK